MATRIHTTSLPIRIECFCCGSSFDHIPSGKGRYPRFCSPECRETGKPKPPKPYKVPQPCMVDIECRWCGTTCNRQKGAKYCSIECKNKHRNQLRRGNHGLSRVVEKSCEQCGASFHSRKNNERRFCSNECRMISVRAVLERKPKRPRKEAIKAPKPVSVVIVKRFCAKCRQRFSAQPRQKYCSEECKPKPSPVFIGTRECGECAKPFQFKGQNNPRRCCSPECTKKHSKRIHRVARKAKQRAVTVEPVNPIKVFIRDGWKCHLCGAKTPRKLRGTYHDRAPELDHIQALSKGGEHSYRNTACSCRKCNIAKSNSEAGQMRLFG